MARTEQQMAAFAVMTKPQLRAEWRRLFRGQMMPPDAGRDLILRVLTNKVQEKAYGGMPPATAKQLRRLAKQLNEQGQLEMTRQPKLKPGTRLVRRWHDKTYHVLVMETGFQFDNRHYASLTPIARAITGADWSGPRFFGLSGKGGKDGQ
jgi:hypothetical protein